MSAYKFLNESLLDDVEIDEVEDSNENEDVDDFIDVSLDIIMAIRYPSLDDYMKNYNTEKLYIPGKVHSVLDAYKAKGVVKSWESNVISDTMNIDFKMRSSTSISVFLDLFVRMFLPRHCMECGYVYSILVCVGGSAKYAKMVNHLNQYGVKVLEIVAEDVFYNIIRKYYPDASDEMILKQFVRSYGRWQAEPEVVSKIRLIKQDEVEPRENVVDGSGNVVSEEWFWNCADTGISEDIMPFRVKEYSGNSKDFLMRYGYFDMVSKKRLTDELFDFAHKFSDSLGLVKTIDGSWKFIDRNGNDFLNDKRIIYAWPFENGFAKVRNRDGNTFIDKKGNFLTSETFENCYNFTKDGIASVEDSSGKKNYIDTSGNYVGRSYDFCGNFCDGFAVVENKTNNTYDGMCYNYMDDRGNEIFGDWLMYKTKDFVNGFGIVGKRDKNKRYRVSGYNYLTRGKKFLLSEWFYKCHDFKNGFAVVETENGMYNIVDEQGKFVSGDRWFDKCYDFSEGFAVVSDAAHSKRYDRCMNYIDMNGQFLYKDGMFDKCYDFKNGFGLVKIDNEFNYINSSGKLVSKNFVENYMELEPVADGVIVTGYGVGSYVDVDGEFILLI